MVDAFEYLILISAMRRVRTESAGTGLSYSAIKASISPSWLGEAFATRMVLLAGSYVIISLRRFDRPLGPFSLLFCGRNPKYQS